MPYSNVIGRSASNPPASVPDDVSALIPAQTLGRRRRGVSAKHHAKGSIPSTPARAVSGPSMTAKGTKR